MKILFVQSNLIGSKIIRWGLEEPVSHVAIEFSDGNLIYHSYGSGIRVIQPDEFYKHNVVVASITLNTASDKDIHAHFLKSLPPRQRYDYFGLLYFAWRGFLRKSFKIPLPRFNAWQERENFLCTELDYILCNTLAEKIGIMLLPENHDIAMVSPWQLFKLMQTKIAVNHWPFSSYSTVYFLA